MYIYEQSKPRQRSSLKGSLIVVCQHNLLTVLKAVNLHLDLAKNGTLVKLVKFRIHLG